MSILPGFGKPPDPPKMEPLPKRDDEEIRKAREKQRLEEDSRKGRRSTILKKNLDALGPMVRPRASSLLGG